MYEKENTYGVYDEPGTKKYNRSPFRWLPFFIALMLIGGITFGYGFYQVRQTDLEKEIKMETITETFDASEIESLDMVIALGDVDVARSSDDKIHITATVPKDSLIMKANGSVFNIRTESSEDLKTLILSYIFRRRIEINILVELPEKEYREVKMEVGAGQFTAEGVTCRKLIYKMAAGKSELSHFNVNGKIEIDSSAGELKCVDMYGDGFDLDISAGSVLYRGTMNGDIDIDCSAGSVEMELTNSEDEYVFSGIPGMGSKDGQYKADIDRSAGNVEFEFDVK